jgi:hypothetical protein
MQIDLNSVNREVASLKLNNIKAANSSNCSNVFDSLDKCLKIQGSIYVYGKTDGYSEFDFPLERLVSPYFGEVPYEIKISENVNIKCDSSSEIEKIGSFYRVTKVSTGSFLKCRYVGVGKGYFSFEYEIPIFQTFPVKEAEWMKGFYPDLVSNTELTLSNIYQKWTNVHHKMKSPEIEDAITYRGRELLLKYEGDSEHKIFDPRKNIFQYEFDLLPGDLVEVSNINGKIIHPKFGESNYLGFQTEDNSKNINAGDKYLAPRGVKPYGFFCVHNGVTKNFEFTYFYIYDKPGKLKCSLNTRGHNLFWFKRPNGQVEATFKVMEINKIINRIPLRLANSKIRIQKKIDKMNVENKNNFSKWISRSLKVHDSSIQALNEVDKVFKFQIFLNAKIENSILSQKANSRVETINDEDNTYLNLNLYLRNVYKPYAGNIFLTSASLFGTIKTNKLIDDRTLESYDNDSSFVGESIESLDSLNKNRSMSYASFLNELSIAQSKKANLDESNLSSFKVIPLTRYMTQVCGNIEGYYNSKREKKQKITMVSLKAIYDTPHGGLVGDLRETRANLFYSQSITLKDQVQIYSNIDFTEDTNQCYFLSASNFVSKNYRDAIFAESF